MKVRSVNIVGLCLCPARRTTHKTVRRRVTTVRRRMTTQAMAVANRMTRLDTTRDGVTWDTTGWTYDPATGLRTAKTYADGSQISYTHTPTGKPLRTTTARGTWSENSYNAESEVLSVSCDGWTVYYRFTADGYDAGVELTTTGGVQLKRLVERDAYRRSLVSSVTNTIDDAVFQFFVYTYDGEGRVTMRNSDAFLYNMRNEVTSATIENKGYLYAYDGIGNFISNSRDGATTSFASNPLNQYVSISPTNGTFALTYDADGNLTFDGVHLCMG